MRVRPPQLIRRSSGGPKGGRTRHDRPRMISPLLLALLSTPAEPPPLPAESAVETEYAQLTIHEQIIIRVPMRAMRTAPPPPQAWHEKKAAKCQPTEGVAAAAVIQPGSVDFIYRGGARLRAELEEGCPSLDFDSGFYVTPTPDRRICAGRDPIRARAGGECQIKRFRTLVPLRR